MESEKHKRCFKCGETKPLSLFYKHPRMSDGHVNKCKECNKKDVRENRVDKNDYYTEYDKGRANNPERHEWRLEYNRSYSASNPEKRKAQSLLHSRVRSGKILKLCNCEHCGSDKNIHGHHSSYAEDMWLLVTWLCGKCHVRLHKDFEYKLGPWSDAI